MTLRWLWEAEAAYFRWFYRTRSRVCERRAGLPPTLGSTRVVYRDDPAEDTEDQEATANG